MQPFLGLAVLMPQSTSVASVKRCAVWNSAALRSVAFLFLLVLVTGAARPVISLIERYGSNQVLVHFDVQANTTCTLQWTDGVKTKSGSTVWSNLWTSPNLPFFEHYIVPDTRTKKQRFYRLQVSP